MQRRQIGIGPSIMQQIYDSTKITPEELISLIKEVSQRHEDGEDIEYAMISILSERYRGKDEEKHKRFVIMQRLDCLTNLLRDERMRAWTFEGKEEGSFRSNEAVFRAAALCRLRRKNGRAYFNPDEFFHLVLVESESTGRA